jgi:putative flippase GtrA
VAILNQHWHLHYLLAQLIATGFGLILTFLINNFWTFA